jgi:hypothetical protein
LRVAGGARMTAREARLCSLHPSLSKQSPTKISSRKSSPHSSFNIRLFRFPESRSRTESEERDIPTFLFGTPLRYCRGIMLRFSSSNLPAASAEPKLSLPHLCFILSFAVVLVCRHPKSPCDVSWQSLMSPDSLHLPLLIAIRSLSSTGY